MKIAKQSLTYATLAVLYIAVVATVMQNAERIFGGSDKTIFAPIIILTLLVISAATMGTLVFGKPVMFYIDGKKREAVSMIICTIGSLAAYLILFVVVLAFARG